MLFDLCNGGPLSGIELTTECDEVLALGSEMLRERRRLAVDNLSNEINIVIDVGPRMESSGHFYD